MTVDQAKAAIECVGIAGRAVAERGAAGMPAGELYALMMPAFDNVDAFERMLALMVRVGAVERRGDLLIAKVLP